MQIHPKKFWRMCLKAKDTNVGVVAGWKIGVPDTWQSICFSMIGRRKVDVMVETLWWFFASRQIHTDIWENGVVNWTVAESGPKWVTESKIVIIIHVKNKCIMFCDIFIGFAFHFLQYPVTSSRIVQGDPRMFCLDDSRKTLMSVDWSLGEARAGEWIHWHFLLGLKRVFFSKEIESSPILFTLCESKIAVEHDHL